LNLEQYKQDLLARQQALAARLGRTVASARQPNDESAGDIGDESVADELKDEQLTGAETDSATLDLIRDALNRIEAGTFGACLIDGEPIEEKRLKAMPWTPYCLKHQEQLEAERPIRTSTI
jgi:RNA polymerase-binding transcription factor